MFRTCVYDQRLIFLQAGHLTVATRRSKTNVRQNEIIIIALDWRIAGWATSGLPAFGKIAIVFFSSSETDYKELYRRIHLKTVDLTRAHCSYIVFHAYNTLFESFRGDNRIIPAYFSIRVSPVIAMSRSQCTVGNF